MAGAAYKNGVAPDVLQLCRSASKAPIKGEMHLTFNLLW
jgi:hypothetical protein